MANLYGKRMTRNEVMKYLGNVEQIGGIRRFIYNDGSARGLEAVEIKTGAGLQATILTGRGLDILDASVGGASFAWISPAGACHPSYADDAGVEFLNTFSGGLLATCGMSSIGNPTEDSGDQLGLHGRYHALPGQSINTSCRWVGNDYEMVVEGEVCEFRLFGAIFRLFRRITAKLGENRLVIEDSVENASGEKRPHQMLYHMNLGFPLMDAGTETLVLAKSTTSRETMLPADKKEWGKFCAPGAEAGERVFYHEMKADSRGMARCAVVNKAALGGEGLALGMRFTQSTLPWLVQWRNPQVVNYVQGMEPANSWVGGRDQERKQGRLDIMKSGAVREYRVELDFARGKKEVGEMKI